MIAARAGNVLIGAGAFVLSFAALTDLARRAGINPSLAWIWSLIIDCLIVEATIWGEMRWSAGGLGARGARVGA